MGRKTPMYEVPDAVLAQAFEERVKWAIWATQLREIKRRTAAHVLLIMAAAPGKTQEDIGFMTRTDAVECEPGADRRF